MYLYFLKHKIIPFIHVKKYCPSWEKYYSEGKCPYWTGTDTSIPNYWDNAPLPERGQGDFVDLINEKRPLEDKVKIANYKGTHIYCSDNDPVDCKWTLDLLTTKPYDTTYESTWIHFIISTSRNKYRIQLGRQLEKIARAYYTILLRNEDLIPVAHLHFNPQFVTPQLVVERSTPSPTCQYGVNCPSGISEGYFYSYGNNKKPIKYKLAACPDHSDIMQRNKASWLLRCKAYLLDDIKKQLNPDYEKTWSVDEWEGDSDLRPRIFDLSTYTGGLVESGDPLDDRIQYGTGDGKIIGDISDNLFVWRSSPGLGDAMAACRRDYINILTV